MKAYSSRYLLRVEEVAGRPLPHPVVREFWNDPFTKTGLATNHFELYELKTGEKTGTLDSSQIRDLDIGYVGKSVSLRLYETGSFSGNVAGDMTLQDHSYGFSTSLHVLSQDR